MACDVAEICGGCPRRMLSPEEYRRQKTEEFAKILAPLGAELRLGIPVFIADGTRRRASLAFSFHRGKLCLGFNQKRSDMLVDIAACPLLTPRLNAVLPDIRQLLSAVCAVPLQIRKGKKIQTENLTSGDVWLCEAANGIDVVLEYDAPLELSHRMILFEQTQTMPGIIRLSHRRRVTEAAEPIIEKARPCVKLGGVDVYIPAGTFLQPSLAGEQALTELVRTYLDDTQGKIADLFCGVGTFSYVLAQNIKNKITAADSSRELLKGFRETVNANRIPNIDIINRNLFKYPFDAAELEGFSAVVLDPPRAGAAAQTALLAAMPPTKRPQKIIMVSCNPRTFVNDAQTLLSGSWSCREVTMVDQFVYSDHSELVALFTNRQS